MKINWRDGNRIDLLENGESFYPRVFDAIRSAKREVIVETFILFEDKVGHALRNALVAAARAGAAVELTVDGYGSPQFSEAYLQSLRDAGIRMRVFDPRRRLFGWRTNLFRRLHRKIVVVDGRLAFVGGINFSADHLADFGPEAKQDYSVEIEGPVVADIRNEALSLIEAASPVRQRELMERLPIAPPAQNNRQGGIRIAFVTRDNSRHNDDIEQSYREALRAARRRIVIASAYFLPGYRLLRALRNAAQRGVDVQLILQGRPDMAWAAAATRSLYRYLLSSGVTLFEYCRRPLHSKVALVDDAWATVGSSNLDPLSLWMNLEANVLVQDPSFNDELHTRLARLAETDCVRISGNNRSIKGVFTPLLGVVLFHLLRHFPRIAGLWPAHAPRIRDITPAQPTRDNRERTSRSADPPAQDPLQSGAADEQKAGNRSDETPQVPGRSTLRIYAVRALVIAFYGALAWTLYSIGRRLNWHDIAAAIGEIPASSLLPALSASAVCYVLYACYEVLAARHVGLNWPNQSIASIGIASYACNLSLGAIVGAVGLRLRLYTKRDVSAGKVAQIVAFSILTNWSGYLFVLGTMLLCLVSEPPPSWRLDAFELRLIGAGVLVLYVAYLWACARASKRTWRIRGQDFELPNLKVALLQLVLSVPVWLATAAALYFLLPSAAFDLVLISLLASAIAGIFIRIPAGLGVIEVVMLMSLGSTIGEAPLLAAMLAFRGIHYLMPLLFGLGAFAVLEASASRRTAKRHGHESIPPTPSASKGTGAYIPTAVPLPSRRTTISRTQTSRKARLTSDSPRQTTSRELHDQIPVEMTSPSSRSSISSS